MQGWRGLGAAVAVAAVGLAAAGCVPEYTGNPEGPKVGILGDSIVAVTTADLDIRLSLKNRVSITGEGGMKIADEVPRAGEYEATAPDVMVVELGANDAFAVVSATTPPPIGAALTPSVEKAAADLGQLLAALPTPHCVVLVNLSTMVASATPGLGEAYNAWAAEFNRRLRARAGADPRLRIADWDAALRAYDAAPQKDADGKTVQPTSDTVHPDGPGKPLFADTVGDAVDGCPVR
jgi:lysophospholipase L1-like esterase